MCAWPGRYNVLFQEAVAHGDICLALYRPAGHLGAKLPYTFTNPPGSTVLVEGDRFLKLSSSKESLKDGPLLRKYSSKDVHAMRDLSASVASSQREKAVHEALWQRQQAAVSMLSEEDEGSEDDDDDQSGDGEHHHTEVVKINRASAVDLHVDITGLS